METNLIRVPFTLATLARLQQVALHNGINTTEYELLPDKTASWLIDQLDSKPRHRMTTRSTSTHYSTPPSTLSGRIPRQRGITVQLDGENITATTVGDLYLEILKYLDRNGCLEKLESILPIRTSKKRFLLARHPLHPGGNGFVIPIEHKGFYLEAHKSYKDAIGHIEKYVLDYCNIQIKRL